MDEKKKAHNIAIVIISGLFVLVILFSYKNITNAVASLNTTQLLIFGIPILIIFGAIISLIRVRLKLNNDDE